MKSTFTFMVAAALLSASPVLAANPAEKGGVALTDILASMDRSRGGGLVGITWHVHVETVGESELSRDLIVRAKDSSVLADFQAPNKVKGQKLLMLGRNMWFMKPGLSKPVPISPRQRLSGQASNADISSTNYVGDYSAVMVGEESFGGEPCYVLDLTAVNTQVTYPKIKYWVSKGKLLGKKAEFIATSGKVFKEATFEYSNKIDHAGKPIPFISKMTITDAIARANVTTLTISQVQAGEIPPAYFNLNLLGR